MTITKHFFLNKSQNLSFVAWEEIIIKGLIMWEFSSFYFCLVLILIHRQFINLSWACKELPKMMKPSAKFLRCINQSHKNFEEVIPTPATRLCPIGDSEQTDCVIRAGNFAGVSLMSKSIFMVKDFCFQ